MTKIYDHYQSESYGHQVGHMNSDGIVYNHWEKEGLTYAIGHVRNGIVYNDQRKENSLYAVGHINNKGVIYDHEERESSSYAIGHVGRNGVVYSHWESESNEYAIGHVQGSIYAAGAAYLLLNASFQVPTVVAQPDIYDEEERQKREYQRRLAQERARMRREKYQRYLSNPKIVAAAREYARKKSGLAMKLVPIFIALVCIGGFKGMAKEAILPVIAIVGLFMLAMSLLTRQKTDHDAFEQKVWELGEAGFGMESDGQNDHKKGTTSASTVSVPTTDSENKPAERKIVACPHCGVKCKAPVGVGTIQITCPNPACNGKTFIIDT